jgi:hypothetical protein
MLKSLLIFAVLAAPLPAFTGPGAGLIDTFAGGGNGDGPALSVPINNGRGMVLSNDGTKLYFCDTNNRRVKVLDFGTGLVTTVAGNGNSTAAGNNIPATQAAIASAQSLGMDGAGNLYIADTTGRAIRKVDTSGIITTFAGTLGTSGMTGDGGPATSATFSSPTGIFVNAAGTVWITDQGNGVVRKVDTGGTITRVAGNYFSSGTAGDGSQANAAGVSIDFPSGVWVDATGRLFIIDGQATSRVIRMVNAAGVISTVAGTLNTSGSTGNGGAATAATFTTPSGISGDSAGNIYISDLGNFSVRKFTVGGNISQVAGNFSTGFSGDGGAAASAQLALPRAVLSSPTGSTVYIMDTGNSRIRTVAGGVINTLAGNGTVSSVPDGGLPTSIVLNNLQSILRHRPTGDLYITDRGAHTVRRVDGATGLMHTYAGNGTSGYSGDGGPATSAQLGLPQSSAMDTAGNLYILESGVGGTAPYIRKVNTSGVISTIAGNGTVGYTAGGTALGAQLGGLGSAGAACDAAGNLYFSEPLNSCIRKISTGGVLSTYAGTCQSAGFSGDGGPATSAQIDNPCHIEFDAAGSLYIADGNNHRVRKVTAGGTISTVAGNGTAGFAGDGAAATAAQINQPGGVWVDLGGALFIGDRSNRRVRRVDPVSQFISTIAGVGTSGFSGDGGPALAAQFGSSATGLTGDENGNLYVVDSTNNRVRWVGGAVTLPTPTQSPSPTATFTRTVTPSNTPTSSVTPSSTATPSRTITQTHTDTATSTITPSITLTPTLTVTPTGTPTSSVTETGTDTRTVTETHTPTVTQTDSPTSSVTQTSTDTRTVTETHTPTVTQTDTPTSSMTPTSTDTRTVTETATPTVTETDTPTSSVTPTGTATPTYTSTATPTFTSTATPSVTPSATPTVTETFTTSPTPTNSATPAWSQSGLGKAAFAPVPLKAGQPLCLYFDGNPSRSRWKVYATDGARVADLQFEAELSQCWEQTAALAAGVYYIALEVDYADGRRETQTQKVMVLR